ncbi:acetylglutamate kinase [bacterium]|nr:acetylglutamate kinase [bacterium]UNM07319.1 MAG: acetylglutamate kinase [Planctomycetales bacterium]
MHGYYEFLRTATPYVRANRGRLFVVKLGGEMLDDPRIASQILEQVAMLQHLGINMMLVHGGAPQIASLCGRLGLPVQMHAGRRITDKQVLEAVSMSLCGSMQSHICAELTALGVRSVGVSGADAGLVVASRRPPVDDGSGNMVDFGEVGDITDIDASLIATLSDNGFLPVVAPLASDGAGQLLNINADTVAAGLAVACGAAKLIFMMRPAGILANADDPGSLIPELSLAELKALESDGSISGGMLPKSAATHSAIAGGVERVHFVSGLAEDALLREIFTNEGSGTMVVPDA